jgi:murein DD-endopeptidase MepM/ murein hydrolase activator NlpD
MLQLSTVPVRADTKSQLKAAQANLDKLIEKISAENAAIAEIQSQADAIAARIDHIQTRMARTQARVVEIEGGIRLAARQMELSQEQLDHRAWVAYENGPGLEFEFLLGSTSLADLNDRVAILNHVARTDQELITQIDDQRSILMSKQSSLEQLERQLQNTHSQLEGEQRDLNAKFDQTTATLAELQRDQAAAAADVKQLKAKRAKEIAAAKLAAALAAKQPPSSGGGAIGGAFVLCPVDQPRAYSDDFGAPRPGHLHAGNDIQAPAGTPIRAPFAGTAVASWDPGGGNDVYVYGSAGYVFNAHLSKYGTTGSVSAGTIVGYVGATGDATGPHDHFEWHPSVIPPNPWVSPYGYSVINGAIDPYPYLNAVC